MESKTIQSERARGDALRINVPLLTQFLDGGATRHQRKVPLIFNIASIFRIGAAKCHPS
jgi:hypothetical protein